MSFFYKMESLSRNIFTQPTNGHICYDINGVSTSKRRVQRTAFCANLLLGNLKKIL